MVDFFPGERGGRFIGAPILNYIPGIFVKSIVIFSLNLVGGGVKIFLIGRIEISGATEPY